MVARYAEIEGITFQEAREIFLAVKNTNGQRDVSPRDITFRIYSASIPVTNSYHPTIDFYCEIAYGGNFWNIYSIYNVQLNRADGSKSKKFDGEIETWLRGGYTIEFIINGDFYNNCTGEISGKLGAAITVGGTAVIAFELTGALSSNHYKYCYYHRTMEVNH